MKKELSYKLKRFSLAFLILLIFAGGLNAQTFINAVDDSLVGVGDDFQNLDTTAVFNFRNTIRVNILKANKGLGSYDPKIITVSDTMSFGLPMRLLEGTAPDTPASTFGFVYIKTSDNLLYFLNDAGTEFSLTAGAAGGETNTVSSPAGSGTSYRIIQNKSGVDFPHKNIIEGTNITIDSTATTITINASGGSGDSSFVTLAVDSLNNFNNAATTNIVVSDTLELTALTASRLLTLDGSNLTANTITGANLNLSISDENAVFESRTLTAGAGLTGGGDLSSNRTFTVVSSTNDIVVNANDITFTPANVDVTEFGSSNLTAGSVVFSDGSNLAQDNTNFFWDDTNNRLGIGTATPLEELHVVGEIFLDHIATANDEHALEIDVDAAGFGDIKALDIAYTTGAISAGEDEAIILINIDETSATGGDIAGLEILSTDAGSATRIGVHIGAGISPIHHDSGSFINPTTATDNTVSTNVANMMDGSTGTTTSIFENDNEYILIGNVAAFQEIEIVLTTPASGAGIVPTFGYSISGAHTFTTFSPIDGTNGFRNTGIISWEASALTGHVTNDNTSTFDIRITRTQNGLGTTPIIGYAHTAVTILYEWDENANLTINSILFEGSTADGFEHTINSIDPTADRTFNFPDDQLVAGDVLVASDASDLEYLNLGNAQLLIGDGSGIPTAAALSGHIVNDNAGVTTIQVNVVDGTMLQFGSDATGDVYYYNGTDVIRLGIGSVNQVLKVAGGVPTWAADATGGGGSATADSMATDWSGPTDFDDMFPSSANEFLVDTLGVVAANSDFYFLTRGVGDFLMQDSLTVTGLITADGLTLGANEEITLGTGILDHNGTDFIFNDAIRITGDLNISSLTNSRIVASDGSNDLVSTITGANLNLSISDENAVFESRTLTGGVGIAAIGDLSANRTITLDLDELGTESTIDASTDFIAMVDATDSGSGKILLDDIPNAYVTETSIASGDFISMVDITDSKAGKITFANFESTIAIENIGGTVPDDILGGTGITATAGANTIFGGDATIAIDLTDSFAWTSDHTFARAGVALDFQNTTDATSNQVGIFRGGNRGTPVDNDSTFISYFADTDAPGLQEFARMTYRALDVTNSTKDADLFWSLMVDNNLTRILRVEGAGIDVVGNMVISGLVDGVDIAARDHAELNDLEATDPPNVELNEVYAGTGSGAGAWTTTPTLAGTNFTGTGASFTAGVSTLATVTDNESTDEENALVFTAGADVDGGTLGLEQDHSGATYNPSSGTITATEFVGGGVGITGVTASHAGTITWTGTAILETGVAFQFGDASDATLTHTYANTGTNVTIAYSTAAMAVTGALTATSFGGITEANLVDKSSAEAITGAWDFGGATSLEVPNGAGGTTVDAAGEVTVDTTPLHGSINFYNSAEESLSPIITKTWIIEDPVANDSTLGAIRFPFATTIDSVICVLTSAGGASTDTLTFNFKHGTNRSLLGPGGSGTALFSSDQEANNNTTGNAFSTFNDATVTTNTWIAPYVVTKGGTVSEWIATVYLTKDP